MRRRILVAAICLSAGAAVAKDPPRPQREDAPRKSDAACAYLGEGYVKMPGTDTCVKMGGSVRAEGQAVFSR
ncbi:porin [Lichenifustis flavocetrariae]|uniref:Porin n=1 Tax=Lichenifustis flavocetrariae TaxID=2949735 RepID=A0AA42CPI2_9HYPH|nr:porin [Lichenifustis flavocetrariae]MCW6510415.1 porin [Lichenifustis flavocetrariae]